MAREAVVQNSTVDPGKLLEIFRRWRPAVPVADLITLLNSFITAAESGCIGQLRLDLLEGFVLGVDAQLCSTYAKINKVKKLTADMVDDEFKRPEIRPGHDAPLAKAALAAAKRAPDQVISIEELHPVLQKVKPKIKLTSTYGVAKRLADSGQFERVDARVYGLPGRPRKADEPEAYEPETLKLFRAVYTAPGHEMGTGDAGAVLGWPSKRLAAVASELRSTTRKLLEDPEKGPRRGVRRAVLVVPQEIVDKLERGEGTLIAPGKMFYAQPGGPPVDDSALVRPLRPGRPRVDFLAECKRLAMLSETVSEQEYAIERETVTRQAGQDPDPWVKELRAQSAGAGVPPQAADVSSPAQRRDAKKAAGKGAYEWWCATFVANPGGRPKPLEELRQDVVRLFWPWLSDRAAGRQYEAAKIDKKVDWSDGGRPSEKPPQKPPQKPPHKK
jgi:hypothetical protein